MDATARCRRTLAAAVLGALLPAPALAQDGAPPEALYVKVYADRYVAAGRPFADLAALESWARPIRVRTVWLDNCDPAATRPLLAAVERFHRVYAEGVQVRALGPGATACSTVGTQPRAVPDAAYLAADASGRAMLP